ncbi:hypothetical protein FEM54_29160 [Pseudomonas edaphica]|uniref:Uncharacterized protein n=1 Tax=Pseudomonas edaphica TaxID=2006980 RepID=A0ABY2TWI5_9PSED|nr:hypothetical protein [Pseudomonas edaphica]TLG87788.1 hypothetical protein FEM54_29160 [Pseudomonas edaphica]
MNLVNMRWLMFLSCCGALNIAVAAPSPNNAVVEDLVSCKASIESAVAFNQAVRSPEFDLTSAEEYEPWGGLAWRVSPPIKLGSVSSDIVIMETNRSFYLRIPSKNPETDIRATAKSMQLTKAGESDDYLEYQKDLADRTIQVQSSEESDAYWVGCFYDQEAFQRAEEARLDAVPERIKQRKQYQEILEAQ